MERRTKAGYKELITGALAVETGFLALQAVGSYARSDAGWSSVFLFGEASATCSSPGPARWGSGSPRSCGCTGWR
ncbi:MULTISPECIES: hypothetical protein [Streptomyces]|uniref:hypothetical protein n=1 Tax=Streptomyces TaxID=1883 RepID=UPI00355932C3